MGVGRLSDLLLLIIEEIIPVDPNQVIDIYKHMAKIIIFWSHHPD